MITKFLYIYLGRHLLAFFLGRYTHLDFGVSVKISEEIAVFLAGTPYRNWSYYARELSGDAFEIHLKPPFSITNIGCLIAHSIRCHICIMAADPSKI